MNHQDPNWNTSAQPSIASPGNTSTPDSPHFTGEGKWQRMESGTKAKILFVVLALGVAAIGGVALQDRWSAKTAAAANTPFATREDSIADRKMRNFEAENPTTANKPPIVLPPAPVLAATGFDPGQLALPKPPAEPILPAAPPRPMMVADMVQRSTDPAAALAASVKAASAAAHAPPGNSPETREAVTAPSGTALPASGGASKGVQPETIEAQALRARERQGPEVTATAQVSAAKLGRRSYVLAKGAFIPCVLETQLVSNVFGMTSCVVTQNVYSDDGKMLLIERGSKVSGNYGSNLRNGDSRLAVIWDRIKTPHGVTVDVNSPGSDGVGAMGLPGVVEMHWSKRIGAAVMLSLMQDAVQYATTSMAYDNYLKQQREQGTSQAQPPVFNASNTTKQGNSIADQVLASSINATPTLYKNRGDVVYVYVANDIWFDRVYGLQP